jgi:RNA polymerase sigma-70 factor (ECF subfamily)
MEPIEADPHLSRIETQWTAVLRAHRGPADDAAEAQRALLLRYGGAVHRYLLGSLRDAAAAELAQEFALRLLRGDFKNADPGKGRFRDYLKRALYHLTVDHHRARRGQLRSLEPDAAVEEAGDWVQELEGRFDASWREELLARTWAALARRQERTGRPLFTVLRTRTDFPELDAAGLAERLSARLGRTVDANWARVSLHRARDQFIGLLLEEVAAALADPSPEELERELIELGLYERCRPALRRRGGTT